MNEEQLIYYRQKAMKLYEKASIVLTSKEQNNIEIADFGLNDLEVTGLQIVTYVNTKLCCAKEMVLFPKQTCPEHRHAPLQNIGYEGKEETFRCRFGCVYLYVEGNSQKEPSCRPPQKDTAYYTVFNEVMLMPGEQFTIYPNTKHWFCAGNEGAVISEFSTQSHDELDIFTDPRIIRTPITTEI